MVAATQRLRLKIGHWVIKSEVVPCPKCDEPSVFTVLALEIGTSGNLERSISRCSQCEILIFNQREILTNMSRILKV